MKKSSLVLLLLAGLSLLVLVLVFSKGEVVNTTDLSRDSLEQSAIEVESADFEVGPLSSEEETGLSGKYEEYSIEKLSFAESGDVVIFFHASWCPSCRALNNDIEKNLSDIPANVTILKADYDLETELKRKYEVTSQHTLVQVDQNGDLIKKWSGGSRLSNLLAQVQ